MKDGEEFQAKGGNANAIYVSIWLFSDAILFLYMNVVYGNDRLYKRALIETRDVDGQRSRVDVSLYQSTSLARNT